MSMQILLLACILIFINLRSENPGICATLQILIVYLSLMFHFMYFSMLLRAYIATKNPWKARTQGTITRKFSLVVIIPSSLVVLFILECYYTNHKQWSCTMFDRFYIRFVVLFIMGGTVFTGFTAGTAMLIIRINSLKEVNFRFQQMVKQLVLANQIRNIYSLSIILTVLLGMNIHFLKDRDISQFVVMDGIFHLFLGFHFILFEWWFHNEEMRKPFKWQRQKDVREIAMKNKNKRIITDTSVTVTSTVTSNLTMM
uniref:Uncharacterized protein n=1 Tax=Clytia hemisphaerica TaxID=252671 RepID=A0A7M5VBX0_9CNID